MGIDFGIAYGMAQGVGCRIGAKEGWVTVSTEKKGSPEDGSAKDGHANAGATSDYSDNSGLTTNKAKVRENKVRRAAERQLLNITKSRSRDPRAADYKKYSITNSMTNGVVGEKPPGVKRMTLAEVEAFLDGKRDAWDEPE